jgi:hypothetical protein
MPAEPATPDALLRDRLTALIDTALDHLLESGSAEPSWLRLVCDASATIAALDARTERKETD